MEELQAGYFDGFLCLVSCEPLSCRVGDGHPTHTCPRCLVLQPFFTPAALFVHRGLNETTIEQQVPYLAIANSSVGRLFAYSPPRNSSTIKFRDDTSRIFAGPRTILSLLASATASQGTILPISSPTNHSAYSVSFYGPVVTCGDANKTTVPVIEDMLAQHMDIPKGNTRQVDSAYFAFVPVWNTTGDLIALSQPRYAEPSNGTNELWMTFQRHSFNASGSQVRNRIFQVCRLHNATFDVSLKWDRGSQLVNSTHEVHEQIEFPNDRRGEVSDMANHAYAAFMWVLTDQLVGSLGWFRQKDDEPDGDGGIAQFGALESPISHTSLLGSVDLDVYFDFNYIYELYRRDNETKLSPQRLQDKELARNRTLPVLVEELSSNLTISLMHNTLLTYIPPSMRYFGLSHINLARLTDATRLASSPSGPMRTTTATIHTHSSYPTPCPTSSPLAPPFWASCLSSTTAPIPTRRSRTLQTLLVSRTSSTTSATLRPVPVSWPAAGWQREEKQPLLLSLETNPRDI
jgi:hypothetical protein